MLDPKSNQNDLILSVGAVVISIIMLMFLTSMLKWLFIGCLAYGCYKLYQVHHDHPTVVLVRNWLKDQYLFVKSIFS